MDEPAVRDGSYGMAVAVAVVTFVVAAVCALYLGFPLRDPDGFLGPTYVRLPVIVAIMLVADVVPRAVLRARSPRGVVEQLIQVTRQRWPWRRLRLALIGLAAFYATYVSYRNLKHFLPFFRPDLVDKELLQLDRDMMGGPAPAELVHGLLGTGISAHVLSWVYLAFLIFVPASLALALVSRTRAREGAWYVTALCLNWSLGTASYYLLPSRGPVYAEPELFWRLPETGTSQLQDSLLVSRLFVLIDPHGTERIHSIAAFASLHVSIIFTAALIAHLTLRSVPIRVVLWVFFALTMTATIYFGWHYVVDDIAGLAIGAASVALAGWGTGVLRRPAEIGDEEPPDRYGDEDESSAWSALRRRESSPAV